MNKEYKEAIKELALKKLILAIGNGDSKAIDNYCTGGFECASCKEDAFNKNLVKDKEECPVLTHFNYDLGLNRYIIKN